jgi:hypothetical protein
MFALSRWLSANLPIEYYEFAKGVEWSIPYMRLPWEGPDAAGMPATAYYSSGRSAARISHQAVMPTMIPTEIPGDGTTMPAQIPLMPMQVPMDGKPLTAMEYRSFFEVILALFLFINSFILSGVVWCAENDWLV